jgi:AbiV family abortive infection protein
MENRTFYNATPEECAAAYPVTIRNSDRHVRVGTLLAASGEYGMTISHLILGAEELLKASLLVMESKGFNLRKNKSIGKLFYYHQARHAIFKEPLSIWLFFQRLVKKEPADARHRRTTFFRMAIKVIYGAVDSYLHYIWWEKANDRKERGLYVDFHNDVLDPGMITKTDYAQALRHSVILNKELKGFIHSISQLRQEQVEEYKEMFEKAKGEEVLNESITRGTDFKKRP